jgi:YebC/PmpR family DNA-binding regulatory protein
MSGHSKWSTIKRKKGVADAKRGQLFTRIGRELAIAAREGGADPEMNFRLRLVVDKAKANNMPKDNIERAIRRGAGLEKGEALEEITYEGYGPGGVAFIVQVVTDNRNRAVSEVRRLFTRHGGSLGESGCVAWLFSPRGLITTKAEGKDFDSLFEMAVEAGAEDVRSDGDTIEIYTTPEDFHAVRNFLDGKHIEMESANITMIASTMAEVDDKAGLQTMALIDELEELDDVQSVYSNLEISDELLEKYEAA